MSLRFWSKVDKSAGVDACWPWLAGCNSDGYGNFWLRGTTVTAHRLAYTLCVEPPGELHVLHRCDNPPCCNPRHLFVGTNADNVADRDEKQRQCRRLTIDDISTVFDLTAAGQTQKSIAETLGVHQTAISHILTGKTWRAHSERLLAPPVHDR